ncbi:MAG: hypothetical protein LLF91_12930 [Xanthomonadaceae bacterium]|nr:hypothetical protein [Xanthomonadaceae bacterium]
MRNEIPDDYVDINFGIDFERARERLDREAGRAFREYLRVMKNPDAPEAMRHDTRDAYLQAHARCRALRPHDTEAIRRILGGDAS